MENRPQKIVSLALGALAAALMVCVVLLYAHSGEKSEPALAPAALTAVSHYDLIDINRATAEELQALPGIGETLAERIVARREETGGFRSAEDVLAVQGIGETTYEKIAQYITF